MAEQPTFTQGLTSLLTPMATVGATVYSTQAKSQINAARIKAGQQPCTGMVGQPYDCPAIFAPAGTAPAQESSDSGARTAKAPEGIPTSVIVVGMLMVAGVAVRLLMPKKKIAAARRRRR